MYHVYGRYRRHKSGITTSTTVIYTRTPPPYCRATAKFIEFIAQYENQENVAWYLEKLLRLFGSNHGTLLTALRYLEMLCDRRRVSGEWAEEL